MSTDGEGTGREPAGRGLGGRLAVVAADAWAAAAHTTKRSQALVRARLASATSPPGVMTSVASVADVGLPGLAAAGREEAHASPASPAPDEDEAPGPRPARTGSTSAGPWPRPAEPDQDRGLGAAILRATDTHVPAPLRNAAAWSWRLLLVAAIVYLSFKVAVALRLLVLPFIAGILLCALLQPLAARLVRAGLPKLAATWITLLLAIGVLAGIVVLITNQVQAGYPRLSAEVVKTVDNLQRELSGPPFHLNATKLHQYASKFVNYLANHKTVVLGTALTGGKYFLEVLAGLILTIFITFFLLKDGDTMWNKLIAGFAHFRYGRDDAAAAESAKRSNTSSAAAWIALVRYIHGTTIIAIIHAVLIGIALWLLGVPLIMPLAILVFIAAYVPLIGILVVGAVAILVTLATQGWIAALILLAVFLAENQIESHLLQPLVIGRAVRLHPLEVIVVLAIGGIVAGIPGAIVAVPTAAVVSAAWRARQPKDPGENGVIT
jgi:predicted PurR-regulated permease PerM